MKANFYSLFNAGGAATIKHASFLSVISTQIVEANLKRLQRFVG